VLLELPVDVTLAWDSGAVQNYSHVYSDNWTQVTLDFLTESIM
jgi:hypothetical protein